MRGATETWPQGLQPGEDAPGPWTSTGKGSQGVWSPPALLPTAASWVFPILISFICIPLKVDPPLDPLIESPRGPPGVLCGDPLPGGHLLNSSASSSQCL